MELFIAIIFIGLTLAAWAVFSGSANESSEVTGSPAPLSFIDAPGMPHIFASLESGSHDSDWASPSVSFSSSEYCINPANGLPMLGGMAGIDTAGNRFGCDSSHDFSRSSFDSSASSYCGGSSLGCCDGFSQW
jgi:hypothetical protein